ncbi:putative metallopeptidase [soil metagenome]
MPRLELPSEYRWTKATLPQQRLSGQADGNAFDFCKSMTALCSNITRHSPAFMHIDMSRVLVTAAFSRNRSKHGLQARVTPLRFRDGVLTRRVHGHVYGLQRYFIDNREMYYLLTFVLPRFLNQTFEEKLATVFHELHHISPAFDGDLRRHPGRNAFHSDSKSEYHEQMHDFARRYLDDHPAKCAFLRRTFAEYGDLNAVIVPRPKLFSISRIGTSHDR